MGYTNLSMRFFIVLYMLFIRNFRYFDEFDKEMLKSYLPRRVITLFVR